MALEETRFQAASGDLESQYDLASQLVMLDMTGTSPGFKEAEIWFRKAAAQGHLQAQAFLCNVYYRGVAVPRVVSTETFRWCQGAAEAGNRMSQFWLGSMYESGEGIAAGLCQGPPSGIRSWRRADSMSNAGRQAASRVVFSTTSSPGS